VLDEVGKRGAGFRSLKDTWADTTTPHGKLMVTVLGGLAEFERSLIAARTGEGRKRAKERGVLFGRPHKMTPHQRQEALQRLAAGETYADLARAYNVDATTIGRLAAASPFGPSAAKEPGIAVNSGQWPYERLGTRGSSGSNGSAKGGGRPPGAGAHPREHPRMGAWQCHLGRSIPVDKRGGWHFPSRLPPLPVAGDLR
jgi:hypothetical protein